MTDRRALLIVDVQNDFCEGGALGVDGGKAVATGVTGLLAAHGDRYELVIASRDWHYARGTNGGHFAEPGTDPDYVNTWPRHCVMGTEGAEYADGLETDRIGVHVIKGMGEPSYSAFEGVTDDDDGASLHQVLHAADVSGIDVAGIATDYCVRASVLDAISLGYEVTVLSDLVAGVAEKSSREAIDEMRLAGARFVDAAMEVRS